MMVGDPRADRHEVELMFSLGYRTMLMVPVVNHGESLGHRRGHVPRGAPLDADRDEPGPHRGQPARLRHPDLLPGPEPGAVQSRGFGGARKSRRMLSGRPHHCMISARPS